MSRCGRVKVRQQRCGFGRNAVSFQLPVFHLSHPCLTKRLPKAACDSDLLSALLFELFRTKRSPECCAVALGYRKLRSTGKCSDELLPVSHIVFDGPVLSSGSRRNFLKPRCPSSRLCASCSPLRLILAPIQTRTVFHANNAAPRVERVRTVSLFSGLPSRIDPIAARQERGSPEGRTAANAMSRKAFSVGGPLFSPLTTLTNHVERHEPSRPPVDTKSTNPKTPSLTHMTDPSPTLKTNAVFLLFPSNRAESPIFISANASEDVRIVGEFVTVIGLENRPSKRNAVLHPRSPI